MYLMDIEDDDKTATPKEISLFNELKLLLLEITKVKNPSKHMTDSDDSK